MDVTDWVEKEMDALEEMFQRDELSPEEYRQYAREILRDAKEQQDRQDIIDAGRGHLLK